MAKLVVDGTNVVGSRPTGWWRDRPRAYRQLTRRLGKLGEPVLVVFDGAPAEMPAVAGVEVRFASRRGRDAADDDIVEIVRSQPGARVVTSDRALAERVRRLGAEVEGAGAFLRRLDDAG